MASWDPKSYVAEALSRQISNSIKNDHVPDTPSYYDVIANQLQSHRESESVKAALLNQSENNAEFLFDANDVHASIVFNPRDMRCVSDVKEELKSILNDVLRVKGDLFAVLAELNECGGRCTLSEELFDALKEVDSVCLPSCTAQDPASTGDDSPEPTPFLKFFGFGPIQLQEELKLMWPKGLKVNLESFMKAWFVDYTILRIGKEKAILGAVVYYDGFCRSFGTPRQSEVWKGGIGTHSNDGVNKFMSLVELCDERPAFATCSLSCCLNNPFGLICSNVTCKNCVMAYSISVALMHCNTDEIALRFVFDWRKAYKATCKYALLGFLLFYGSGKIISDEEDSTVGENDAHRLHVYSNSAQKAQMHQKIEQRMSFEEFALTAVVQNRNADNFHLLFSNRNLELENEVKKCFFNLPEVCTVASYLGYGDVVGVTLVDAIEISRVDSGCSLCLSRSSPVYNYIYMKGSHITLNFFLLDGLGDCERILKSYPTWRNETGNEPVIFEHAGTRCATMTALQRNGIQVIFSTIESFLAGDSLYVVGQLSHKEQSSLLMRCRDVLFLCDSIPSKFVYPFFLTTVTKRCGTVGLMGWGCHLCSLQPPMISICCPSEASALVLEEANTGPKCVLTFFSKDGGYIFSGANFKDLRSSLPTSASAIVSTPHSSLAFRLTCTMVRSLLSTYIQDYRCILSVQKVEFFKGDPVSLMISEDNTVTTVSYE